MESILAFFPVFLLVLVRLTSFFVSAPIFSSRGVPNTFKVGLSFFLSLIVFTSMKNQGLVTIDIYYVLLILKEIIVGLSIGFVASLFLYALQVAGSFIDMQMGLAIANVVDPQTGAQSPLIGNFKYILAILFLLSLDGHLMIIKGALASFQFIPVDQGWVPIGNGKITLFVLMMFAKMFLIAFQLAFPLVASLFLVDAALGIIAKTVPQLNVFVVGLPIKIYFSFIILILLMPVFFYLLKGLFSQMFLAMNELMKLLGA
ncbi:flagellar type III secretion system protein FliR [Microaerobacter geothermalis]|uniref:flagellar biosynthetic protein FliR n=1 Tax=Microaerobacter geothermalis TaxID=674972 RepID=UPI001F46FB46|nr:flagellar biosynthetic protein FliR [Microaerobacter geothermalis]MCF6093822.1 flagellar type III secretion system protein FliR [Microaerobacter geothermalis]